MVCPPRARDAQHPNIDNNLMIRLQREKREQREKEEAEKREKLKKEGTIEAKEEMQKMERQKKLHVGNISKDKWSSKHEKSSASSSADPVVQKDEKVKVHEGCWDPTLTPHGAPPRPSHPTR